jgi:hypothetical protein
MKTFIFILISLLIASNAFWLYQSFDTGITLSYKDQQIHQLDETRKQLMLMLPELAQNDTKDAVINAAKKNTDEQPFRKDGCIWIAWLGFKFDPDGKLSSLSPVWNYGEEDPCYQ